jgi:hypothetical protein
VCDADFQLQSSELAGAEKSVYICWIFNTMDALILTYCSTLKHDAAYITLNSFWILVGIVGILRAGMFCVN